MGVRRTRRRLFHVEEADVRLRGWVRGAGTPVLLLHGGPGLGYDYVEGLADELGEGFSTATYQQRGLTPSSEAGPFRVADHVDDLRRVLDALGWERAVLLGHSWGGHLALHFATVLPERTTGVLAVDPLGGVGDGGEQAFEAEMSARVPDEVRTRAEELDERALRGESTDDEVLESFRLVWPAYFPSWDSAPPMPQMRASVACYAETFESIREELPRLEAALPSIGVPVGFVAGAASPIPTTASTDTAERIPGAWVETIQAAGHFPWLDVSGSVRSALHRLCGAVTAGNVGTSAT